MPKTQIAIIGDAQGAWDVKQVLIVPVSHERMAQMRRYGQVDSGKRQRWLPIEIQNLPEPVVMRLFELHLLEASMDFLHFGDNPMPGLPLVGDPAEARRTAEEVAKVICQVDPSFEVVMIDHSIPTV